MSTKSELKKAAAYHGRRADHNYRSYKWAVRTLYTAFAALCLATTFYVDLIILDGRIHAGLRALVGREAAVTVEGANNVIPPAPPTPIPNQIGPATAPAFAAPAATPAPGSARTFTRGGTTFTITDPDPATYPTAAPLATAAPVADHAGALSGIGEWGWQPPEAAPTTPAWLQAIQPDIPAIQPAPACHPPMTCAGGN